ncbi:unnamed protein product, partial [marine sediment metagenome]
MCIHILYMNFKEFLEWITKHNGFLHESIIRKKVNGIFGMYATQNIPKNTVLTKLPYKTCIISRHITKKINNTTTKTNDQQGLIIFLIREYLKGEKSFYYPYLKNLPTYEDYVSYSPLLYNEKMFSLLQKYNSNIFKTLSSQKKKLLHDAQSIQKFDSSLKYNDIVRFLLIIKRRAWGYPKKNLPEHFLKNNK